MRRLMSLCGLLAGLILPTLATASDLIRLTNRDDLLGWEAVGRIDLGQDSYCTGTLIADNLVLTAAHCVFDKRSAPLLPERIVFRAGLRDGAAIAARNVRRFVVADGYAPSDGMSAATWPCWNSTRPSPPPPPAPSRYTTIPPAAMTSASCPTAGNATMRSHGSVNVTCSAAGRG